MTNSNPKIGDSLPDRFHAVIRLREAEGKTFNEIGTELKCSGTRARQIYLKAKRLKNNDWRYHPFVGLSVRAANCCNNANLRTREQILAAINSGRLHPSNTEGCRNYGWGLHAEIHKWLGLPKPKRDKPKFCPHCGKQI